MLKIPTMSVILRSSMVNVDFKTIDRDKYHINKQSLKLLTSKLVLAELKNEKMNETLIDIMRKERRCIINVKDYDSEKYIMSIEQTQDQWNNIEGIKKTNKDLYRKIISDIVLLKLKNESKKQKNIG